MWLFQKAFNVCYSSLYSSTCPSFLSHTSFNPSWFIPPFPIVTLYFIFGGILKKDVNMNLAGLKSTVELMGLVSSDAWGIMEGFFLILVILSPPFLFLLVSLWISCSQGRSQTHCVAKDNFFPISDLLLHLISIRLQEFTIRYSFIQCLGSNFSG